MTSHCIVNLFLSSGNYPDIDKAAKVIAAINDIDHTQVKYDLLDKESSQPLQSCNPCCRDQVPTARSFSNKIHIGTPPPTYSHLLIKLVFLVTTGTIDTYCKLR